MTRLSIIAILLGTSILATNQRASSALVHLFELDTSSAGTVDMTEYTHNVAGLVADGVTFDATLTVRGSNLISRDGSGIGVQGGTDASINLNDALVFAIDINLASVVGGTVTFDGFTGMDFTSFLAGIDVANVITSGGTTSAPNDPTFSPALENGFALEGGSGTTSFRVGDISASFTGTAMTPEPSGLLLVSIGSVVLLRRRRGPVRWPPSLDVD